MEASDVLDQMEAGGHLSAATLTPRRTIALKRSSSVPLGASSSKTATQSTKPAFKIALPVFIPYQFSEQHDLNNGISCTRTWPGTAAFENASPPQVISSPLSSSLGVTALLTPPEETPALLWLVNSQSQDQQANSATSRALATPTTTTPSMSSTSPTVPMGLEDLQVSSKSEDRTADLKGKRKANSPESLESNDETGSWLDEAIKVALSGIPISREPKHAVRVVCQALPFPAEDGEDIVPTTAFHAMIAALQVKVQPNSPQYITIFHVVPPKFMLSNLPTSPPSTPSGAIALGTGSQEDYFNVQVFNSAVPIHDRHDLYSPSANVYPASPGLAVPPSSVDIALYERFIPPSTVKEFLDLFEPTGPSALVDRLVELSPGGALLFIYPTKSGAMTFTQEYLGPILEPLLRHIIWDRGLSADIGSAVSKMAAVDYLTKFGNLKRQVQDLVRSLSRAIAEPSEYELVFSSQQVVQVQREVWQQWWLHQEMPRINSSMEDYIKRGTNLPKGRPLGLAKEITEGLPKGHYDSKDMQIRAEGSGKGIEVGVFVIKRKT